MNLGAKYLNVEKYLSVEDITNLDELSMVVYLYDWYFGVSLLQKQDIAARRLGNFFAGVEIYVFFFHLFITSMVSNR